MRQTTVGCIPRSVPPWLARESTKGAPWSGKKSVFGENNKQTERDVLIATSWPRRNKTRHQARKAPHPRETGDETKLELRPGETEKQRALLSTPPITLVRNARRSRRHNTSLQKSFRPNRAKETPPTTSPRLPAEEGGEGSDSGTRSAYSSELPSQTAAAARTSCPRRSTEMRAHGGRSASIPNEPCTCAPEQETTLPCDCAESHTHTHAPLALPAYENPIHRMGARHMLQGTGGTQARGRPCVREGADRRSN